LLLAGGGNAAPGQLMPDDAMPDMAASARHSCAFDDGRFSWKEA